MGRIVKAAAPAPRPASSSPEAAEAVAVLVAARAEAERLLLAARPAAVVLAAKMAEKIVGRAVELDASVMAEIAGEALAACRPRHGLVRLRAHPDDLAALEARRDALLARLPAGTLELVADERVGRAGCIVDTSVGRVDARLDVQLAALERALGARDG